MATRAVNLYVNGPFPTNDPLWPGRLLRSPTSSLPPILPPIVGGDTWNIKLYYYLGDGSSAPFANYRFPGAVTEVRLRSGAGVGIIYATALASSEITPAVVAGVSRFNAGGNFQIEKQDVAFDATAGSFRLTFPPPGASLSLPNGQESFYCVGTTPAIPVSATALQIQDTINSSLQWFKFFNGHTTSGPFGASQISASAKIIVSNWTQNRGFRIEFGTLNSGSLNNYVYQLPLVTLDDSAIQFAYGWNVTLLLDGNGHTFSDLLLAGNKPAYLEVVITPAGETTARFASQTLLASAGDAPAITSGPPPNGAVAQPYSFTYIATGFPSWAITAGSLPSGLGLGSDGVISGIPAAPGSYAATITATNATGSVNQAFTIVIAGSGGAGGGGTINANGVIYDGDHSPPFAIGQPIISHGLPDDSSALIWRQKYRQRLSFWSPLIIGGTNCPFNGSAIAVDESPTEWTGIGDVVEFDRVWAMKPSPRRRPGSFVKNYKKLNYNLNNGQIDYASLVVMARSQLIDADYLYDYFNIIAEGIPLLVIPDIIVEKNGPFVWVERYGTTANDNYGYCLIGQDTRQYMGPIWERVLIYGQ